MTLTMAKSYEQTWITYFGDVRTVELFFELNIRIRHKAIARFLWQQEKRGFVASGILCWKKLWGGGGGCCNVSLLNFVILL